MSNDVSSESYRIVGGKLLSATTAYSNSVSVELLRRGSLEPIGWQFRQPKLALFLFGQGIEYLDLMVNGKSVHSTIKPGQNLAIFPVSWEISGEFTVRKECEYTAIFIDPGIIPPALEKDLDQPMVAFGQEDLRRNLATLASEAATADNLFDLFAEGWTMQTLVTLARLRRSTFRPQQRGGGLSNMGLNRVKEYMHENLSQTITIEELANIAGVSRRHFQRAFQDSVGQTPLRYVNELRNQLAQHLLASSKLSITEIALDCGFSQAQHFASNFKSITGKTPSTFRKEFYSL